MASTRIPVVLVTGFLGSGKTTLLNHLMRDATDTRVGVIVNDFGSINIDALAVAGQVDSMIPIENGCLCCAADASEMDAMLERLADPSARIDVIVVEASGLAEPQSMIRTLLSSENEAVVYGGLVEVVDAAEFESTRERHPEIERHLRAADVIVLNKTDRVTEERRDELLEAVRELCPGAPVVAADHGRIDPGLLFDPPERDVRERFRQLSFAELGAEEDDHSRHLHAAYESVEFTSDRPLHPVRFMGFLDSRPTGLYRVKGFVRFAGAPALYGLHAVGSFLRFEHADPARGGAQLVLIGAGIDSRALEKELAGCVAAESETVEEHQLLGVLRYVREDSP